MEKVFFKCSNKTAKKIMRDLNCEIVNRIQISRDQKSCYNEIQLNINNFPEIESARVFYFYFDYVNNPDLKYIVTKYNYFFRRAMKFRAQYINQEREHISIDFKAGLYVAEQLLEKGWGGHRMDLYNEYGETDHLIVFNILPKYFESFKKDYDSIIEDAHRYFRFRR